MKAFACERNAKMKLPLPRTFVIVRAIGSIAVTGLVAMMVAACGTTKATTMSEAAATAFVKDRTGCQPTVRERPDLPSSRTNYSPWKGIYGTGKVYEVTGCNADVIYDCGMEGQNANRRGQTWEVAGECSPTGWCTPDGCDSVDVAARNTFVKDKTCPLERVTATRHAPMIAPPPSDIAADPERMRMWTENRQQQIVGHTFMAAAGCGSETVYDCMKPSGTRAIPVCKMATVDPQQN